VLAPQPCLLPCSGCKEGQAASLASWTSRAAEQRTAEKCTFSHPPSRGRAVEEKKAERQYFTTDIYDNLIYGLAALSVFILSLWKKEKINTLSLN